MRIQFSETKQKKFNRKRHLWTIMFVRISIANSGTLCDDSAILQKWYFLFNLKKLKYNHFWEGGDLLVHFFNLKKIGLINFCWREFYNLIDIKVQNLLYEHKNKNSLMSVSLHCGSYRIFSVECHFRHYHHQRRYVVHVYH
jgi:hypothetical protein